MKSFMLHMSWKLLTKMKLNMKIAKVRLIFNIPITFSFLFHIHIYLNKEKYLPYISPNII